MLEFRKLVILLFVVLNVAVVLFFAYTWTSSNSSGKKAPKSAAPATNNSFVEQQDEETKELIRTLAKKYTDEELGKLLQKPQLTPAEPVTQTPIEETSSETQDSKIRRLRVVTMMTDDNISAIRGFVGRFHILFPPDSEFKAGIKDENTEQKLSITIYGLRLNPVHEGEIRLWKNVDLIDVFSELVSTNMISVNGKVIPEEHQVKRLDVWRPLVLKHAVEKYGKILFLDPNIVPTEASHIEAIDKHLEGKDTGSIYTLNPDAKEEVLATDDRSNTLCNFGMIGMKLGSYAYTNILVPQVKCSMARICNHDELRLWSPENRKGDIPKAAYCTEQFKTAIRAFSASAEGPCTIVHREDVMFSPMQVAKLQTLENAKKVRESDPNRVHIALGFPATSKGNANPQIGNAPFFTTFLPTFLQTISPGDAHGYLYKLYMGIDYFDPFYDNPQIQQEIKAEVYRRAAGYPVEFEIVRCAPSRGWVVYLWNILFQYAIENGADYFYQLNDDIRFISGGWAGGLSKILRDNPVKSNLGVSGPRDTNNGGLLTQSFVHKTHYEIFGYYYPPIFENWYSDDWVTVVYSKARSVFRTEIQVHNSQNFGTRYHVCSDAGKARLETAKKRGEELIDQWLAEHK